MLELIIRPAREEDLPAINDIYNYYVRHSTCTYQEAPESIADRRAWYTGHDALHPVIVAEVAKRVVGWGALSAYHARAAYRYTVEDSVYVEDGYQQRGIGAALLDDLLTRARTLGLHAIIACIDADQAGSIALHEKYGFTQVGRFAQIGCKFGRWLDVVYLELELP
jgi:phosphinothricin acetyltransferase